MTTLIKVALAATIAYALAKVLLKSANAGSLAAQTGVDAGNPPSSLDDIPTLRPQDTVLRRIGPLPDGDLDDTPKAPF